jgi:hypothetical protein
MTVSPVTGYEMLQPVTATATTPFVIAEVTGGQHRAGWARGGARIHGASASTLNGEPLAPWILSGVVTSKAT